MCTGAEMMMISIATSAATSGMQMMAAQQQAAQQAAVARQQRDAEIKAARQQAEAEFAEANRQIAEAQEKEVEDKADLIREANEELGTLRAAETALTDGSLGNLFFENAFQHSADLVRITENVDKLVDAQESSKLASSQGFSNAVTVASNNATNTIVRARANAQSSKISAIGSTLNVAASSNAQRLQLNAAKK